MSRNAHGLKRHIDAPTRRVVRQRCAFGCIFCGCAIVQYHHFNPEFAHAKRHNPDGITLLCGTCHTKATNKIITLRQVIEANANPKCRQLAHTKDFLYIDHGEPFVRIGASKIMAANVLMFENEVIIGILPPESPGAPFRFNANLTGTDGKVLLKIRNNEWETGTSMFDVETSRAKLVIRRKLGGIVLAMSLAGDSGITFELLDWQYRGFKFVADTAALSVQNPHGAKFCHNGTVLADIGVWMHSDGSAHIAANNDGGAAIFMPGSNEA